MTDLSILVTALHIKTIKHRRTAEALMLPNGLCLVLFTSTAYKSRAFSSSICYSSHLLNSLEVSLRYLNSTSCNHKYKMPTNTDRTQGRDNNGQQTQRGPQPSQSQRIVSGRPSQMQLAIPGHDYGRQSQRGAPTSMSSRTVSGRPSQMQVASPTHNIERSSMATQSGRPSQMHGGAPSQRYDDYPPSTVSGRPSSTQIGSSTQRYDPPCSAVSGRPSQMQVAPQTQRNDFYGAPSSRQLQTQRGSSTQSSSSSQSSNQTRRGTVNNYTNISIPPSTLQAIREGQATSHNISSFSHQSQSSRTHSSSNQMQSTFVANHFPSSNNMGCTLLPSRPSSGRTQIIRLGEPHHFGSGSDPSTGAIFVTLCRCSVPTSHGDAYTMLNSPRGNDIYGQPIEWQEAKKRMLDHYGPGTQQISHQQEVEAMPFVFDEKTAKEYLRQEGELEEAVRRGDGVRVNVEGNRVDWHR